MKFRQQLCCRIIYHEKIYFKRSSFGKIKLYDINHKALRKVLECASYLCILIFSSNFQCLKIYTQNPMLSLLAQG